MITFTFVFYNYSYSCELHHVIIFLTFAIVLAFIIMSMSYIFSIWAEEVEKASTYECGFDPFEDARNAFDVRFYIIAMIFLIFDLEAIYIFPWCASLCDYDLEGFWIMCDFIIELFMALVYAWKYYIFDIK